MRKMSASSRLGLNKTHLLCVNWHLAANGRVHLSCVCGGGDPMLSMLEWFCEQMMEAEVPIKLNADKSERSDGRSSYRYGYCPIRLDIRLGTIYLMDPKVR